MRRDTLMLIEDAVENNRQAYVLVNNRLECNAPTLEYIAQPENWGWSSLPGEEETLHLSAVGNCCQRLHPAVDSAW